VSFNRKLSDPGLEPASALLDYGEFYSQVIGTDPPGEGTDRLAGKRARLFVHGVSRYEIRFRRPE
jgi:hypothetical protein